MNKTIETETLYTEYGEKVRRYVFGKVFNPHDAEDLVNDVFVKAFEKWDSFDSKKASASTWIYTIAHNTVIDYYRARKEFCEIDDEIIASDDTEAEMLNDDMLEQLADALESLDPRSRKILVCRYYNGRTLKDIARQLNISYAYVKILHNTALAKLKQYLQ